jgi:hypothetical protein
MQCHSILSFQCKLIFTKAIQFFSLVDHGAQVFKYVDWRSWPMPPTQGGDLHLCKNDLISISK